MRLSKTLVFLLAASALAAPAFADPPAHAPAHGAAGKAEKQAKREARLLEAMKKQGISDAKAKNVVAVMKSFHAEMRGARQEMKSAKAALKQNENDKAARDRKQAAKQKIEGIKQRRSAALAKILTPAEHAKVKELIDRGERGGKHGKGDKSRA
jgi:hypothetical protein